MLPPAEPAPPANGSANAAGSRRILTLCALGVLVAAADTYVIVLALPDLMTGLGLDADELQRAAPLVSMFLLGYVVALPLAGRLSDVAGRRAALVGAALVFAAGSVLTASADSLGQAVLGRFGQGAGGGALVPVTLALVADLWPAERRGVPLGVVGAVQELGAVLGPLFGAAVLAVADWPVIFWIGAAVGLALALGASASRAEPDGRSARSRSDLTGAVLAGAAVAAGVVAIVRPAALERSVTWGGLLVPAADGQAWTTPLALGALAATVCFVARELTAARPLLNLRRLPALAAAVDAVGALLLGVALGAVVLAFATADPAVEFMAPNGPWLLAGAAVAVGGFWLRQRRARHPLVPPAALAARPAWGALLVSVFVGAALAVVVVDVPILARTLLDGADQLDAALLLLRFLAALPVGAVLGGWLIRRLAAGLVAAAGMALAAVMIAVMATWTAASLDGLGDDVVLAAAGLGFGLAVAPVNAALLAATPASAHGVASALLVAARMVGMLAGLSALTAIGLRRLHSVRSGVESPAVTCPDSPTHCPPYDDAIRDAVLAQLHATFVGAAGCAAVAALSALLLLRPARRH